MAGPFCEKHWQPYTWHPAVDVEGVRQYTDCDQEHNCRLCSMTLRERFLHLFEGFKNG